MKSKNYLISTVIITLGIILLMPGCNTELEDKENALLMPCIEENDALQVISLYRLIEAMDASPYLKIIEMGATKKDPILVEVNFRPRGARALTKANFKTIYHRDIPTFNVGDSRTNNGYGGDAGTQSRDAEMMLYNGRLLVYGNDHYKTPVLVDEPDFAGDGDEIEIEVKDEFLSVKNNTRNTEIHRKSASLYALAGQPDTEGPANYKIYLGYDRFINPRKDCIFCYDDLEILLFVC